MAEGDESEDKSFEASPKKLQEARRKGNVPQSTELLTLSRYIGMFVAVTGLAGSLANGFGLALVGFFNHPFAAAQFLMTGGTIWSAFSPILGFFVAMMGLGIALVVVALVAQGAITFSGEKIKPDLKRLSPIKNAGQKFGPAGLADFGKNLVKIVLAMLVGVFIGWNRLPDILASVGAPSTLLASELRRAGAAMLMGAIGLAALATMIDVPVKWGQYRKKLRMSLQELRDESKETEGDPEQRKRRQAMAREFAQNRQIAEVPTADVVIVNPQHYAVALKWNRHANEVPRCIAKGVDHIALRIRSTAQEAGVPVYRDVAVARSLHATVEVGEEIRREHYAAVAAAIRFADALKKS